MRPLFLGVHILEYEEEKNNNEIIDTQVEDVPLSQRVNEKQIYFVSV